MDEPTEKRRMARLQQVAVVIMGLMLIAVGLATVFEGKLFNPYFPAGAVFAPFAFAGGALLVVLGIRGGRPN
jgi:hypothetical protein